MDSRNDRAGSFIKATIRTKTGFVYKNPEPLIFEIQNEKITDMRTGVTFLGFNDFFMHLGFQSFEANTPYDSLLLRGKLKSDLYKMGNFHRHVIPFTSYRRLRRKLISDVASQYKKHTITISERRDN